MGKSHRRRNTRDDNGKGDAPITSSSGDGQKTSNNNNNNGSSVFATTSFLSALGIVENYMPFLSTSTTPGEEEQPVQNTNTNTNTNTTNNNDNDDTRRSFYRWCLQERQGIIWVLGCMVLGSIFGMIVGSGLITGEYGRTPNAWRISLGGNIRTNLIYRNTFGKIPITRKISLIDGELGPYTSDVKTVKTLLGITGSLLNGIPLFASSFESPSQDSIDPFSSNNNGIPPVVVKKISSVDMKNNPSHPYVYAVLREAVTREKGGYVHPDLGFMESAPCGAARGLGMVRNVYHRCQTKCVPGIAEEKLELKRKESTKSKYPRMNEEREEQSYLQEEVLIRVPLSFQMTRKVALDTLLPRITSETQRKTVHELDDAALLVLLLAHERGVGQYSPWLPYIASLPHEPSCGYSQRLRPYLLDTINALRDELGMDVDGWPGELIRATEYSERIVSNLANDYGSFLQHPKGMSAKTNIRWALCHVASRATGGFQKYGALRLIPLIDVINHDAHAGGFVELTGKERLEKGDFLDAIEEVDGGTFVVRSLRHGRRKALRMGQELLVNYNVPHYSALDWLVSSGFVPPERYQNWQKLDAPLPRIRRDGPFAGIHDMGGNGRNSNAANFGFASATY